MNVDTLTYNQKSNRKKLHGNAKITKTIWRDLKITSGYY